MRFIRICAVILALLLLGGCGSQEPAADIAATTSPVAQFAQAIAEDTPVTVAQVISEPVSCLHDYTLSVEQMKLLEQSDLVLLSGLGLEDFMTDVLADKSTFDCSQGAKLLYLEGHDDHDGHDHGHFDPHLWLSPENAKVMAENICNALTAKYPDFSGVFRTNTDALIARLEQLQAYGRAALSELSCRKLITFHDGFAYLAHSFDLEILESVEEESGSEASAKELIHMIELVKNNKLPAIFTEKNGSVSAASVICAETGVQAYALDMAMGGSNYFAAMEENINTLKEALQ